MTDTSSGASDQQELVGGALPLPSRELVQYHLQNDRAPITLEELYDGPDNHDTDDVGERVRQYHIRYNGQSWPVIKHYLTPMLAQGKMHDVIAFKFNVSLRTVGRWVLRLHEEYRQLAINPDVHKEIGEVIANKKRRMLWYEQQANSTNNDLMKVKYMSAADKCEMEIMALYDRMGVGIDAPLSNAARQAAQTKDLPQTRNQVDVLADLTKAFLSGQTPAEIEDAEVIEDVQPLTEDNVPETPPIRRRTRPGTPSLIRQRTAPGGGDGPLGRPLGEDEDNED